MKVLREGQCVNHPSFGIGIATESNKRRTTVDFYDHGVKKFVTDMFQAQLVAKAPPRPRKTRAKKKAVAATPPPAEA